MKTRNESEEEYSRNPMLRWNALVEEFDRDTRYTFDRLADVDMLVHIAAAWPRCRPGLHFDLAAAANALAKNNR